MKKLFPVLMAGLVSWPVWAQAPVSDVSTPSSQRRAPAYDDGYDTGSARTYGAGESTETAIEDRAREDRPVRAVETGSRASASSAGGTDTLSLYRQLQQLQEEVASLRSQVEEQGYQLQKLKQQQSDDFASIDRRLAGGAAPAGTATAEAGTATAGPASSPAGMTSEGKAEYEAAYTRLKGKDYDGAAAAFKSFVAKYPTSEYTGNSYFWLGFIYQTKGDLDNAGKSFATLIERFPSHSKTEDAKYNLGKIYHQQGQTDKARSLLKSVAAGSSKSAPLAKTYLESM